MKRYKVVNESVSCHCCFSHSVVDTEKPTMLSDNVQYEKDGVLQYEQICECFNEKDAKRICNALNKTNIKK